MTTLEMFKFWLIKEVGVPLLIFAILIMVAIVYCLIMFIYQSCLNRDKN